MFKEQLQSIGQYTKTKSINRKAQQALIQLQTMTRTCGQVFMITYIEDNILYKQVRPNMGSTFGHQQVQTVSLPCSSFHHCVHTYCRKTR